MPYNAIREMVADWRGAGRALGKPDTVAWYQVNRANMRLHPFTEWHVQTLLGIEMREFWDVVWEGQA